MFRAQKKTLMPTLQSLRNRWTAALQIAATLCLVLQPLTSHSEWAWADTDGDGYESMGDHWYNNGEYLDYYSYYAYLNQDTDGDGLSNLLEMQTYSTNPYLYDTDSDGLGDFDEVMLCNQTAGANYSPTSWDTNGDGVSDYDDFHGNTSVNYPGGSLPNFPGSTYYDYDGDGIWNSSDPYPFTPDHNSADGDGDGLTNEEESQYGTYDTSPDSDGDGLTDYEEVRIHLTSPLDPFSRSQSYGWGSLYTDWQMVNNSDSDVDGIPDNIEAHYGLDASWPGDGYLDMDQNGINNRMQYERGIALNLGLQGYDQDEDGMSDVFEDFWWLDKMDPSDAVADNDGDGVLNYEEMCLVLSPVNPNTTPAGPDIQVLAFNLFYGAGANPVSQEDLDSNGQPDWYDQILAYPPHPSTPSLFAVAPGDTDGDGMPDAWEHRYGWWRFHTSGLTGLSLRVASDALQDAEGDGLANLVEFQIDSNPVAGDTNGDAILDGDEDYDQDGLSNYQEQLAGTDLADSDSDNDGISDGEEAASGTDPCMADLDGDEDGVPDSYDLVPYDANVKVRRGPDLPRFAIVDIGPRPHQYSGVSGGPGGHIFWANSSNPHGAYTYWPGPDGELSSFTLGSIMNGVNGSFYSPALSRSISPSGTLCGVVSQDMPNNTGDITRHFRFIPGGVPVLLEGTNKYEENPSLPVWGVNDSLLFGTTRQDLWGSDYNITKDVRVGAYSGASTVAAFLHGPLNFISQPPVVPCPEPWPTGVGKMFLLAGFGEEISTHMSASSKMGSIYYVDSRLVEVTDEYTSFLPFSPDIVRHRTHNYTSRIQTVRMVVSGEESSFVLGERNLLQHWDLSFEAVTNHEPRPWLLGPAPTPVSKTLAPPLMTHLWLPQGTSWEPCPIYGSSLMAHAEIPLDEIWGLNSDGHCVVFGLLMNLEYGIGIWANGEAHPWTDYVDEESLQPYATNTFFLDGFADDGTLRARAVRLSDNSPRMLLLVPVDFGIHPEEVIVPADVATVDIPTWFEALGGFGTGAEVEWEISQGTGGSLAETDGEFLFDEQDLDTTLHTSHHAGDEYQVRARLTSLKVNPSGEPEAGTSYPASAVVESGKVIVGPGEVNVIDHALTTPAGLPAAAVLPADGTSTLVISADLKDDFGNPVAGGTQVFWRLKGDGRLDGESSETDEDGRVHAVLRAGRVANLDQTVVIEADFKRVAFVVENTPLGVELAPGTVNEISTSNGLVKEFTVTASASAADGTPVRWFTSRGSVLDGDAVLQSGSASATIQIHENDGASGDPVAVVIASVAESAAVASVDLAPEIAVVAASSSVAPGAAVALNIAAPSLAGQWVEVVASAREEHHEDFNATAIAAAQGVLTAVPNPGERGFEAQVTWEMPPEPEEGAPEQPFQGGALLVNGVYALTVDANGLPTLTYHDGASGTASVTLIGDAAAPPPGGQVTLTIRMVPGVEMSLACPGEKASASLVGLQAPVMPQGAEIPEALRQQVVGVVFSASRVNLQGAPPALSGLDANGNIQVPASGVLSVNLTAPADAAGQLMEIVVKEAATGVSEGRASVPVVAPGSTQAEILELATSTFAHVQYDNREASATEASGLARHAARHLLRVSRPTVNGATLGSADFAPLVPPAFGGDLENLAAQGRNFLAMAKKIEAVVAQIEAVSRRMDTLVVEDEQGRQLFQAEMGRQGAKAVLESTGLKAWFESRVSRMNAGLSRMGDSALRETVKALQGTMNWTHLQIISNDLGHVPLIEDFDKLAVKLTEEGLVDFIKALAKLSKSVSDDPQAATILVFDNLEQVIGGFLDERARNGGSLDQRLAVLGGYCFAVWQSTAVMAATASESKVAIRRMLGHLMATIISASLGSQKAKDELEKMCPLMSWFALNDELDQLLAQKHFFLAGKKICELLLAVAGDVTIVVPLLKGAALAVRVEETVARLSLAREMFRSGPRFLRRAVPQCIDAIPEWIRWLKKELVECFPAGTLVLMGDGSSKPIEDIRLGDIVMADDPLDNLPARARNVNDIYYGETEALVQIHLDSNGDQTADLEILATREHPLWTLDAGWINAEDLSPGQHAVNHIGEELVVISTDCRAASCRTWNLNVEGDHAFFVGDGSDWMLVHNLNKGPRTFVAYEAEFDFEGKKYYYNGRASAPGGKILSANKVMKSRYKSGFISRKMRLPDGRLVELRISIKSPSVRFEAPLFSDGNDLVDATDHKGRPKKISKAEMAVRGTEHAKEAVRRAKGVSLNIRVPSGGHPCLTLFQNAAARAYENIIGKRIKCK